jgi:DNA mismatch repair protein MutS
MLENNFSLTLEKAIDFIANIDVALSNAKASKIMNLTRPIIEKDNFYEAIALRHPIIEANEQRGIYIPNDIYLGKVSHTKHNHITLNASNNNDIVGILLYGINSSGKSSLMKSVGISIILAQAGFFVPAVEMRFGLYEKIFTRIVSKDNLYKGLSTFAVEMIELKNIFNRANNKSIIVMVYIRVHIYRKSNPLVMQQVDISRHIWKWSMIQFWQTTGRCIIIL